MIIDCVSDLHGYEPVLEGGDLLIVAGDLTRFPNKDEMNKFTKWLFAQKYEKIVFIAGNHDRMIQEENWKKGATGLKEIYLEDSGTEFKGYKIWGSPWVKKFRGMNPLCSAFATDWEEELEDHWKLIPKDTDILITHSPPKGVLDLSGYGQNCGSDSLYERVYQIVPLVHVFGHVHEAAGTSPSIDKWDKNHTLFVNCSICDRDYKDVHRPVRIIL
jgi:Icc-related predicted phosphoesterase